MKTAFRILALVPLLWLLLAALLYFFSERKEPAPAAPQQPVVPRHASPTAEAPDADPSRQAAAPITKNLLQAIKDHDFAAIQQLINNPAQLELADLQGNTVLHLATIEQDPLLVQLLLAYGADPVRKNNNDQIAAQLNRTTGRRAYQRTAEQRYITRAFITQAEREPTNSDQHRAQLRFFLAARLGDTATARRALAAGADPGATQTHLQHTVLHTNQHAELVAEYLDMGVPLDAADRQDRTALTLALTKRNQRLVQTLLAAGAKTTTTRQYSDIGRAISRHSSAATLVGLLLEAGEPVTQRVWLQAIGSRNGAVVERLLKHEGAFDPNSELGRACIAQAVKLGGPEVLEVLQRDPQIAASFANLSAQRDQSIEQGVQQLGKRIRPHLTAFAILVTTLTVVSSLAAMTLCSRLRSFWLLTTVSSVVLTHLFVFSNAIETGLNNIRLFGESAGWLVYTSYVLVDAFAFALAAMLAVVIWELIRPNWRNWLLFAPANLLYVATLVVIVGHNAGSIQWPAELYRSASGYNAYIAEQELAAEQRRRARKAASKTTQSPRQQPPQYPVFDAIGANDVIGLNHLIAAGASVQARNEQGKTALLAAMSPIRLKLIDVLLAAGADINAATADGMTPICTALKAHRSTAGNKLVKLLLAHEDIALRSKSDCAPVMHIKDAYWLRYFVSQGADLNARRPYARLKDEYGIYHASALWQAAYSGDAARAITLLDLGADIEQRDTKYGMTPVLAALAGQYTRPNKWQPMLKLLLNRGANTEVIAWNGQTLADLDKNQALQAWQAQAD